MTETSFRGPWKVRRPASSPGAGLLVSCLAVAWLAGCGTPNEDPSAPSDEERAALGLRAGADLHRVTLGGRGSEEHAVPSKVVAEPGDAVEFRTVDHRVHTVSFLADSLAEGPRAFLEGTGQIASPPLVVRGSRFVVLFQDAPPGRYPFESSGHGGRALGVVEVGPQQADSTGSGAGS